MLNIFILLFTFNLFEIIVSPFICNVFDIVVIPFIFNLSDIIVLPFIFVLPFTYKAFDNLELFKTFIIPPIFIFLEIPIPPGNVNAPVSIDTESIVDLIIIGEADCIPSDIIKFPFIFVFPCTTNVVLLFELFELFELLYICNTPPIFTFLYIPTPPFTVNAPLLVATESFSDLIEKGFVVIILPPTYKFFCIPTPPLTVSDPLVVDVESVTSLILILDNCISFVVFNKIERPVNIISLVVDVILISFTLLNWDEYDPSKLKLPYDLKYLFVVALPLTFISPSVVKEVDWYNPLDWICNWVNLPCFGVFAPIRVLSILEDVILASKISVDIPDAPVVIIKSHSIFWHLKSPSISKGLSHVNVVPSIENDIISFSFLSIISIFDWSTVSDDPPPPPPAADIADWTLPPIDDI